MSTTVWVKLEIDGSDPYGAVNDALDGGELQDSINATCTVKSATVESPEIDVEQLQRSNLDLLLVVETYVRAQQKGPWGADGPPITHPQFDLYNWARAAIAKARGK